MNKYLLLLAFLIWTVIVSSVTYKATLYFNPCSEVAPIVVHDTINNPIPEKVRAISKQLEAPKPNIAKRSLLRRFFEPQKQEADSQTQYQAQWKMMDNTTLSSDSAINRSLCDSIREYAGYSKDSTIKYRATVQGQLQLLALDHVTVPVKKEKTWNLLGGFSATKDTRLTVGALLTLKIKDIYIGYCGDPFRGTQSLGMQIGLR